MKILYVTDVFPPRCGGSGWSVYFFARGLRELGHQVDILALDTPARDYDGFAVQTYPIERSGLPFFANYDRETREVPRVAERIKERSGSYDIVHAHHKLSALAAALAAPERLFVTIRDYWPICMCGRSLYRTGAICSRRDFMRCSAGDSFLKGLAAPFVYSSFRARIEERLRRLENAHKLLCISHYVREQLVPFFPPETLEVPPNFAAEIAAGPAKAENLPDRFLLYVGRLEENKGPQLLPEILQLSKTELPLVLLGEGSMQQGLASEFRKRGVQAHFPGYREYPQMLSILSRAELLLFPSIWPEPLGRVLIEAAMLGKAAIAFSHAGGHRDIVDHDRTGMLVENPQDYAAAIDRLLSDDALRQRLGREARRKYENHFSPEAVLPKLLALYQS